IARGSSAISEAIFLAVHSGKRTGHGVAVPTNVTRENVHSVLNTLQGFARTFGGVEFEKPFQLQERMDKLAANQPSARAAVEMALFDLAAQAAGMPLYAYLGGRRDRMVPVTTDGLMATIAPDARPHGILPDPDHGGRDGPDAGGCEEASVEQRRPSREHETDETRGDPPLDGGEHPLRGRGISDDGRMHGGAAALRRRRTPFRF